MGHMTYGTDTSQFDLVHNGKNEAHLEINLLGEFNVKNALAVAIAAQP